jgi:lysozyme
MNENRKLTERGAKLIQHFEGCLQPHNGKFKSYLCPANVRTIGWGSTGHPHGKHKIDANTIWTAEECHAAFLSDMESFERDVRKAVRVPLTDYQFDALVSFTYNVGSGNLNKSTLLRHVNEGNFADAAREFKKWNKAGGKELKGLTRRRNSEAVVFAGLSDNDYDGIADDMPHEVDDGDT